jgi:chloramphenicol-sensitive protein RarD
MSQSPANASRLSSSGIGLAVVCYALWGLVPVYWKGIIEIPATEAMIPRIVWSLILLWIVTLITGRTTETWTKGGREWGWTLLAALLLAGNWYLFVYAVLSGQIVATSLGYYINPLVSIMLGLVILGERLSRTQAIAVAIAAFGVATLTLSAGELPWISLVLAMSFATYGVIHKLHPQPPIAGLTREMMVLSPLSLLFLAIVIVQGESALASASLRDHAYLSFSGVVTAVPLLLFHAATRRLPLVAVGMFQYIAPTITLLIATFFYKEPFTQAHALGFGFVWIGLAVFTFDSMRRSRIARKTTPTEAAQSAR